MIADEKACVASELTGLEVSVLVAVRSSRDLIGYVPAVSELAIVAGVTPRECREAMENLEEMGVIQ